MHEVLNTVAQWHAAGIDCAVATIIDSTGSTPRPVGTTMAVSRAGAVAGSISGGCLDSDIFHTATEVLASGEATVRRYAVDSDDESVALMCGGSVDVLIRRVGPGDRPGLALARDNLAAGSAVVVATVVSAGAHLGETMVVTGTARAGSCGDPGLDAAVIARAVRHLESGTVTTLRLGASGECAGAAVSVLISPLARPPRLLVFGAVDFAQALVRAAKPLGYSVTVCDARPVFATPERFPDADEVVARWPRDYLAQATVTPSTAICVLTHDPRFDVPVLELALRSRAGYVGAMGSRRTHTDRMARLRAAGLTESELGRLCSPIGLDLGAATPEETAVSILAEVIALRRGGSGARLAQSTGPIHQPEPGGGHHPMAAGDSPGPPGRHAA